MTLSRRRSPQQLSEALATARQATLASSLDLTESQWRVPYGDGIQPTAWDLAHIAWFAEFWLLRGPHRLGNDGYMIAAQPPRFFGPDEHYDSARIIHSDRWRIELFDRSDLLDRMQAQLTACCAKVASLPNEDDAIYWAHMALRHELMHVEALAWTRSLLSYPSPPGLAMPAPGAARQIAISGGEHRVGTLASAFAFDNEQPAHTVRLAPFTIDSNPVTNSQFREFVSDDGYQREELWPDRAAAWLAQSRQRLPTYWRQNASDEFEHRWYDRWVPLPIEQPVVHVNAFEAEAYCRWAGRRLPTAVEWEAAADQITWGNTVWEWTATPFAPYEGFRPGPYTTYSTPWFHHQRELRGGSYATDAVMHDRRYRNFFLPHRSDIFGGFRTVQSS